MRYRPLILAAMQTLACQSPSGGDGDGPGDGDGDGPGDGDGDGPGDGDGDGPGDGDGYCDLTQIPLHEPLWLEEIPSNPIGSPVIPGLAVGEDAVFSAGYYADGSMSPPGGFVTRRNLDGQLQWAIGATDYRDGPRRSLSWDGEHLYYTTHIAGASGLVRVDGDGQAGE